MNTIVGLIANHCFFNMRSRPSYRPLYRCDDGCGFTDYHTNGVGLTNIQNRLHLFFGESSTLQLEENKPSGIKAILTTPYE